MILDKSQYVLVENDVIYYYRGKSDWRFVEIYDRFSRIPEGNQIEGNLIAVGELGDVVYLNGEWCKGLMRDKGVVKEIIRERKIDCILN